jgi:glycosyltransferase involved in cell wall biosynthesis
VSRVSVCVTTYNRARLLDRTLASLAAQTRPADEIVVSDDASPDDTADVVESWRSRLPQLVYLRAAENGGMPRNLNRAIEAATGDYVANVHDADTFSPVLLERWADALDRHPSAGFVFCGIAGWPEPSESQDGVILHDVAPLTPGREFFERFMLHRFSSIVWGTVMARRSAYDRLLPFDSRFGFVSDVDMWMRMCLHFDVAYVREPLIVLDHTPTEQRGRGVNWRWVEWARAMQLEAIHRFFGADRARLELELGRHRRAVRRYLLRRAAGRLWHRDLAGVTRALRYAWAWGTVSAAA